MRGALATGLMALLGGCGPGGERPGTCAPVDGDLLVASATDFQVGALSAATLDGADADGLSLEDAVAPAGGDPLVAAVGDRVALLERSGGHHLRIYTPGCWDAPDLEVGLDGANPHHAVLHDALLWVTPYERSTLWALDPADGRTVVEVDLSGEADADGLPETDRLVARDGRLFAALQRLDREAGWTDAGGRVVEVDEAGVVASHPVGPSPKLFDGAEGLVVLTGLYGVLDGAVRRLDPDTGEVVDLLTEAELGFDVTHYVEDDGHGVVVGVDPLDPEAPPEPVASRLRCLDLETGAVVEGPSSDGWYADATAAPDGTVWLAVRSGWGAPGTGDGLVPLDPVSCTAGEATPLLLEPFSLTVRRGAGSKGD